MKKIVIAFIIILSCTSCSKLFKNKISEDVLIEQALNAIESNDKTMMQKLGVDGYPKFNFGKYKIIKSYNYGNFYKQVTTQFENGDTCLWVLDLIDENIMFTYGLSKTVYLYYKNNYNIQLKYEPTCSISQMSDRLNFDKWEDAEYNQKINARSENLSLHQSDDSQPIETVRIKNNAKVVLLGILAFGLILTLILLIWNSKYTSQHNS